MNVFSIPPTVSFVDALAKGILRRHGAGPMDLAAVTVLLPNRRACRALQEAFLRQTDGKPLLLPTIRPIGDVDEEGVYFNEVEGGAGLPQPVPPIRRLLVLSRYLKAAYGTQYTTAQSLSMASELSRFLDSVQTEGVSLDALDTLVPEQYAEHWQKSLVFLKNVLRVFWPQHLLDEGLMDAGDRRRLLIEAYTDMLQKGGVSGPVIAAGSTGSIPATAELLKTVASMPEGSVVLPGLDTYLEEEHWTDALEEGHPQAGLARLLLHMDVTRAQVMPWLDDVPKSPREIFISQLMRPAAAIASWTTEPLPQKALDGLSLIEAETLDAEAAAIALIMREHVEDTKVTGPCVLVTPDRILAGRVSFLLKRWGITLDDSGGTPLPQTPVGHWLLLLCDVVAGGLEPISLLALLKHDFAAGSALWPEVAGPFKDFVLKLDREVLRGPRLEEGFQPLINAAKKYPDVVSGLEVLARSFEAAEKGFVDPHQSLRGFIELAENLASTPAIHGGNRLWSGEDGEAMAGLLSSLLEQTDVIDAQSWTDWRAILETAMASISVRPRYGTHPYLSVLGPIEARLYQAEKMILGSLNENTWPRLPEVDGWLSRGMRKKLELPSPERAITLSAHDFAQSLGSKTVFITRSKNRDGAPTTPSRWIQRMDTLLAAQPEKPDIRQNGNYWLSLAQQLDKPDTVQATLRPAPNPPLSSRPRKLSVTEIAKWRRDPYFIFAKHVLKLRPLDPIAGEPDGAQRGTMLHDILKEFGKTFPAALPENPLESLRSIGEKYFKDGHRHPDIVGHWRPRFERMIKALITYEALWRESTTELYAEIDGRLEIPLTSDKFVLEGRADRIENRRSGWAIIDYKSGAAPSKSDVKKGDEPQLALLAAMLARGAFSKIGQPSQKIESLAYWEISGNSDTLKVTDIDDVEALLQDAYEGITKMASTYLEVETPYTCWPDPAMKLRDGYEYAHLARIAEWSNADAESDWEDAA
ncbi:MAG: double-strand break repair protein AddB [Proteobacteria bacterium]|nr:double-strand break repair protein AddB [Pseudomonadota bacterium]